MTAPLPQLPKLYKHPFISNDLQNLKSAQLKIIALNLIEQLIQGNIRGKRLENHDSVGNLSNYLKLYFDVDKDRPPRYRIVYRYIPDSGAPTQLQILVIATRENLEVYKEAVKRMKDLPSDY
jgi:hypothetical protein